MVSYSINQVKRDSGEFSTLFVKYQNQNQDEELNTKQKSLKFIRNHMSVCLFKYFDKAV